MKRVGLVAGVALLALFGVEAVVVGLQPPNQLDIAATRAVQGFGWGPLLPLFTAVDWLEGLRQAALAAAIVVVVFLLRRRATLFALACAASGAGYWVTQLAVARPRPAAALVHVVRHTSWFSFPSGHEVFFTWFLTVVIVCFVAAWAPRLVPVAWVVAAAILVLVGVSRVWEGEHWPSDVVAGFLLGGGWTLVAYSLLWRGDARRAPSRTRREPASRPNGGTPAAARGGLPEPPR